MNEENTTYRSFSQIVLTVIAALMICLLIFIQFGLPHEDHMTKQ